MKKVYTQKQPVSEFSRYIGIDLGDKFACYCEIDAEGEVVDTGRVKMNATALRNRFQGGDPARIAIETGAQTHWVKHLLVELGHEVVVANARELRSITASDRKSDKNDAEKLARYVRVDPRILSPVQLRSMQMQRDLTLLRAREVLVRARTMLINSLRGTLKIMGLRLRACASANRLGPRFREQMPAAVVAMLEPVVAQIDGLAEQIRSYEGHIEEMVQQRYRDQVNGLKQIKGIGTLTAIAFVLTIGDHTRFERSRQVGNYLGLRPRRKQSGERDPELGISKAGDGYLRKLLVQAAHRILNRTGEDSALRRWGLRLAERPGAHSKKKAIVAVARKLAVLMHRLWVTGANYEPFHGAKTFTAA